MDAGRKGAGGRPADSLSQVGRWRICWEDGKTYAWRLRTNNSLVVQANDEKQKKIADAIYVLRVEMLLEHLATLVNDRDYAGYVDLLTDDEVVRLASVMSRDKTPLESPSANSPTPSASAEILKEKRQFIIDVLAAGRSCSRKRLERPSQ